MGHELPERLAGALGEVGAVAGQPVEPRRRGGAVLAQDGIAQGIGQCARGRVAVQLLEQAIPRPGIGRDVGDAQFLTGGRASHLVRGFGQGQQARGEGAELVGGGLRQGWRAGRISISFLSFLIR